LRLLVFLLLLLMVFMGVAAYELQRRGLLTRETYDRFVESRSETQESTTLLVEPVGLAASIQERRQELREETDGLSRLNAGPGRLLLEFPGPDMGRSPPLSARRWLCW